jgi:hypothetical protein
MNPTSNYRTLNTIKETIQDVRYIVGPVVSDPTKPTLFARIHNFFGTWNQSSQPHTIPAYDAWGKASRPGLH